MPNDVTNILRVTGDAREKQQLFESIKSEKMELAA